MQRLTVQGPEGEAAYHDLMETLRERGLDGLAERLVDESFYTRTTRRPNVAMIRRALGWSCHRMDRELATLRKLLGAYAK